MSHPQLDNLVRIGQLKVEPAAAGELTGLVRSGIRRLDDAARAELSVESRFDVAYNAAHAFALAALLRVAREVATRVSNLIAA